MEINNFVEKNNCKLITYPLFTKKKGFACRPFIREILFKVLQNILQVSPPFKALEVSLATADIETGV